MIDIFTSTLSCQQLRRIAPLQLQAMVRRNETAGRLLKALCLLARYFPEACEEYNNMSIWQARTKWMDIMLKFYQLVDNAFFKVDWRLIELAQRNWTEAKGSAESEKLLALFLKYIPFLTFGFTMADTFVCPPIKLLSNFLHTMPRNFDMPVSALVGLIPDINQEDYSGLLWDSQASRCAWSRVKAIKRNPEAWRNRFAIYHSLRIGPYVGRTTRS